MKHLLKLLDCSSEEIVNLLDMADQLKYENKHNIPHRHLEGKSLGLIFEKLSTRTRVSFETGMYQLGGRAMFLSRRDMQTNRGEPMEDTEMPYFSNFALKAATSSSVSLIMFLPSMLRGSICVTPIF